MGKAKQIVILVCFLFAVTASGWCMEQEYSQDFPGAISDKLEKLQIYFETEMYEEAAELLDELIIQFPDEPRFKYLQAVVDYQRQDFESAKSVFTEFTRDYPEVPEPYYILGEINLEQGDLEQARQYFTKYSELVPEDDSVQAKLNSIATDFPCGISIIKDGHGDSAIVEKIGFYGACVSTQQEELIKLVNGRFGNWSSMGVDFVYPIDLRGKQIVLKLKGKQGGESFMLTFRDKFAPGYEPQLVLSPEEETLSRSWRKIKVAFAGEEQQMDLSSVVHLGLEFGSSTVQNPPNSVLYVKDIIIEDSRD